MPLKTRSFILTKSIMISKNTENTCKRLICEALSIPSEMLTFQSTFLGIFTDS